MGLKAAARTDVGKVREKNEDSYLIRPPLYAVADGLGGHAGGEVASSLALETLSDLLFSPEDRPATLTEAAGQVNEAIVDSARADSSLEGMGTTLTAMLANDALARIVHVGDSRAYLLRAGELRRLTRDDSLLEKIVRESGDEEDDGDLPLPSRNILTQALGRPGGVEPAEFDVALEPGDWLLLCSDGLTSVVDSDAIRRALAGLGTVEEICDGLVDAANAAGGPDNITVIVVEVATKSA